MLRGEDQFHTGIVVDDVEGAQALLAGVADYEWPDPITVDQVVRMADGRERTVGIHMVYSRTAPRLELVRSVPGTPFTPAAGSGIHHLGYWADDVGATLGALVERGWSFEMGGVVSGEDLGWAYCTNPAGFRVELVDGSLRAPLEQWWSGG
jgi:hypothetical protein